MDGRLLAGIIVAVVLVGVLLLMTLAWRRRIARDTKLGPLPELPEPRPRATTTVPVLYVATSKHDQPLERLALPGLSYRSRAVLEIGPTGVVIDVPGERPTFVPAATIVGIDQTNFTIDRVVEPGGLIRLSWHATDEVIADSTFRVLEQADRARLIDAVSGIIPATEAAAHTSAPHAATPSHNESAS